MKKLLLALLVIFLAACNPVGKKEFVSGILIENMDNSVNPGDNFFTFVNGTWIKNTEIPADKPSYHAFMMLHEVAEKNIKSIIEEIAVMIVIEIKGKRNIVQKRDEMSLK